MKRRTMRKCSRSSQKGPLILSVTGNRVHPPCALTVGDARVGIEGRDHSVGNIDCQP